jgi:hypothetical protein
MFSKEDEDFLESLSLNASTERKKNKSEKKKTRIKFIVCTVTYHPDNGAKNLTRLNN